jgi:hypothetical protein
MIGDYCFGNCELFVFYFERDLKIWRMNSAFDRTFIGHFRFPSYNRDDYIEVEYAQMDDEYIAVFMKTELGSKGWWTVYFVSTKTFEVERSLSIARKYGRRPQYERGFLVLRSTSDVR